MKRKFLALSLLSVIFVSNTMSSFAFSGGWNEESGYFKTPRSYEQNLTKTTNFSAYTKNLKAASSPKHTGKKETSIISGTSNERAHGWTTWVGVRHYTRAMVTAWSDENDIFTDSSRVWGVDGTEAISPWYASNPESGTSKARTYYGK